MDNVLQGIPYVAVRRHTGVRRRHCSTHATVLRLNEEECTFLADKVVYLGQLVTREGIQPIKEKVKAVTEAPEPENDFQLVLLIGYAELLWEIVCGRLWLLIY